MRDHGVKQRHYLATVGTVSVVITTTDGVDGSSIGPPLRPVQHQTFLPNAGFYKCFKVHCSIQGDVKYFQHQRIASGLPEGVKYDPIT